MLETTGTMGKLYIRWQDQTLYYSNDSGATWKLFSTHPASQADFPIATAIGKPSRGYRTAQILLNAGYVYASLYVWQSGKRMYSASAVEAAMQVAPEDLLVEAQASNSKAYEGYTASQLLTLTSLGEL